MSGPTDHGLKNLFGSLPDLDAEEAPPAADTAAPQQVTARSGPDGGHGLSGIAALPDAAPAPPPAAPAPVIDGVPSGAIPAMPDAPAAPAPAPGAQTVPTPGAAPLTVVLVAQDAAPARTLDALRRQTAAALIDVVVVGGPHDVAPGELRRLTRMDPGGADTYGQRAALGIQAAQGDLVALLDDYAFPATDWAEQVLTHRHEGFAALGSTLANANPRSNHSWSHMLLEYGAWREGGRPIAADGGEVAMLPARNLVFRREAVTALPELASLLDEEGGLLRRLEATNQPFIHDEEARLAVLNPSTAKAALKARYAVGRLDGARWGQGQSLPKRFGKAARAGLGGYARYKRDRSRLFTGDAHVNPKQHGNALALAMIAEGFGRAVGFLRGPGKAADTRARLIAARYSALNKTDRRQFETQNDKGRNAKGKALA